MTLLTDKRIKSVLEKIAYDLEIGANCARSGADDSEDSARLMDNASEDLYRMSKGELPKWASS